MCAPTKANRQWTDRHTTEYSTWIKMYKRSRSQQHLKPTENALKT